MKITLNAEVRNEIERLCADVLRVRDQWALSRNNVHNGAVSNGDILNSQAEANAIVRQIQGRAFRIASLAMGEKRRRDE